MSVKRKLVYKSVQATLLKQHGEKSDMTETVSPSCEIGQRSTLQAFFPSLSFSMPLHPSRRSLFLNHTLSFCALPALLSLFFLQLTLQCYSSVSSRHHLLLSVTLHLSLPLSDTHTRVDGENAIFICVHH